MLKRDYSNEQNSAFHEAAQKYVKKNAISEYKHCKSIHLREGELLNFCFSFYTENVAIQENLVTALKEYGFTAVWNTPLHIKADAFMVFSAIGIKLNLKSFITKTKQVFQLANQVGANYLLFEIGEVINYYDLGQYQEDLELQEAIADGF